MVHQDLTSHSEFQNSSHCVEDLSTGNISRTAKRRRWREVLAHPAGTLEGDEAAARLGFCDDEGKMSRLSRAESMAAMASSQISGTSFMSLSVLYPVIVGNVSRATNSRDRVMSADCFSHSNQSDSSPAREDILVEYEIVRPIPTALHHTRTAQTRRIHPCVDHTPLLILDGKLTTARTWGCASPPAPLLCPPPAWIWVPCPKFSR